MIAPHEKTPSSIFLRIANNDEQAFATAFDQYYSRIYSTALQYCKVKEYAEDVTQQVFISLWEQRLTLATLKNPEAWLWTVTRNQTLKKLRREITQARYRNYIKDIFAQDCKTPEEELIIRQKGEIIERALASLPPRQQQVFRLSRYEGSSYKEIANLLGISRDTVKEHLSKAIAAVKSKILSCKEELLALLLLLITVAAS